MQIISWRDVGLPLFRDMSLVGQQLQWRRWKTFFWLMLLEDQLSLDMSLEDKHFYYDVSLDVQSLVKLFF